ncbi:hypothetical protein [Corynebacterium tuberculostearicum]|uniref:hypothetical protein n=1 Tax=Corynebacterium tuberculostearicum TaxID=38304 RepID=UPI0020274BAB|nr:hypothetical protein [Corynebacterium tuberculostearicum]MCG7459405.1 hypothetical protein [Corynebacterium tuberculostearicum]
MQKIPENHFDLQAAAFYLAEILNNDALSENRFRMEPAASLPKYHGVAAWINKFLYFILKVETPSGTAFVGFETIFHPRGTFQKYSVEYENVHDLWAYDITGESILKNLDFEDPNRIAWFKTDSKNFVPSTWNDVLGLDHTLNRIWMRD